MGLGRFRVVAGLAVSDMDRAVDFYEEKLGLKSWTGQEDNRAYECGEGTVLHVYLSPDHAGGTTATLASWYVREIESLVDVLTSRGVVFERYDRPPILTDARGIATFEGGAKVAYFKDPDGNTLSLAQVGDRSYTEEDR
jgi:catechol 2,3-dioxygenase-like lactoylglutathione lyase family enzyme